VPPGNYLAGKPLANIMYSMQTIMYSEARKWRKTLELTIEQFLASVEKKAYRMAEIATRNQSDALDIVQDTMIKLVEKYAHKPAQEWKPLFYRILNSRIMDYFRRQKIYRGLFFWKTNSDSDSDFGEDLISQASDFITPERELTGIQSIEKVTLALKKLPPRQQQCFLLRSWEGLNVKETALAMGCSEGSVKTHYSRAKESLKKVIEHE
jgi:RNA polymerase sigma-70 factor (ECF subfamily)